MATRLIGTGESRESTSPCVVCQGPITGPGAEYVQVEVVNEVTGQVCRFRETVRRHFLNDTHTVTLRAPIDHKPVPHVQAF